MKRFLAISLILVLMFSNMGITLATHYCGGEAVKTRLVLGNTEINCGMEEMNNSCDSHTESDVFKNKNCCDNDYVSIGVEDVTQPSLMSSKIDSKFLFSFVYAFTEIFYSEAKLKTSYQEYSPPTRNLDIQVLFQSFLI